MGWRDDISHMVHDDRYSGHGLVPDLYGDDLFCELYMGAGA